MAIWRREVKTEPASPVGETAKKVDVVKKEELQKGEDLNQRDSLPKDSRKKETERRESTRSEEYGWRDDYRKRSTWEEEAGKKGDVPRDSFLTLEPLEELQTEQIPDTPLEENPPAVSPKRENSQEGVSPEEYARFAELASERKKHRKKEVVAIRISPETLALARATGKGYTGFLSRLLDEAIRDPEMVKRCL